MSEKRSHACPMCPEGRRKLGKVRGLCQGHYRTTRLKVKAGETTWKALAALGLVVPTPEEQGLRRGVLFEEEYRRRMLDKAIVRN